MMGSGFAQKTKALGRNGSVAKKAKRTRMQPEQRSAPVEVSHLLFDLLSEELCYRRKEWTAVAHSRRFRHCNLKTSCTKTSVWTMDVDKRQ